MSKHGEICGCEFAVGNPNGAMSWVLDVEELIRTGWPKFDLAGAAVDATRPQLRSACHLAGIYLENRLKMGPSQGNRWVGDEEELRG